MSDIVAVGCLVCFMVLVFMVSRWIIHIYMSVECVENWGWGNYKFFKKHFNEVFWEVDKRFKGSLFSYDQLSIQVSKIHADQFKFNGIHMVMTNPISYWMCKNYVRKYFNDNYKKEFVKKRFKWE